MKRSIESRLLKWKNDPNKKPLIIRGARQVGKTYTIKEFGKSHFKKFVHFDFTEQKSIHQIFSNDLTAANLLIQLEAFSGTRITSGDTLVFFDEIQECPRALTSLRYFYEQKPDLHVIAAGSLLEFSMGELSFPVGRVDFEWMYPMSFSEFLVGMGHTVLRDYVPTMTTVKKPPSSVHHKLLEQLRLYCIVGGMPEAVALFASTNSLTKVSGVHRRLVQAFRQDIPRYHRRADAALIEQLFDAIPRSIGRQIKYSGLVRDARIDKIKAALQILERGLLVHRVCENSALGLPLGANITEHRFKMVFLDVGLMQYLCGIPPTEILQAETILDIYKGALAEQLVGQQLLSAGIGSENGRLFYWARETRGSSAEVDYVIVRNGAIHPVEVKSGATGKLKSMSIFLKEHPAAGNGIVLSAAEYHAEPQHRLVRMPIYTEV